MTLLRHRICQIQIFCLVLQQHFKATVNDVSHILQQKCRVKYHFKVSYNTNGLVYVFYDS